MLTLDVRENQGGARAFYEALGFTPTGEVRRDGLIGVGLPLRPQPRELRTERLLIRQFEEADLDALHDMRSREESVRWLYEDPPSLLEDRARLERRMHNVRFALTGDGIGFAVLAGSRLVADVSLFLRSAEHHQGEIGFITHPDHWGKGYATEAARAALAFGLDELALDEIVSFTAEVNLRSRSVMERIGMTHDPADDFDHPRVADGPLRRHVLYRSS
jgi:ribosomal-protein-alanine N-acetyltransferase